MNFANDNGISVVFSNAKELANIVNAITCLKQHALQDPRYNVNSDFYDDLDVFCFESNKFLSRI